MAGVARLFVGTRVAEGAPGLQTVAFDQNRAEVPNIRRGQALVNRSPRPSRLRLG